MPFDSLSRVVARNVDGRTVLSALRSTPPVALRATTDGLTLVASAFGPLGGDRTRIEVLLEDGARLRVGSAGAQVAQPGEHDVVSRASLRLDVGAGAHLHWQPRPLVVATSAEHRLRLDVRLETAASAVLVETAVLGRGAEVPGRYRSRWRVTYAGQPLLCADLDVGSGAAPGWDGPAAVGGARVLTTVLVVGGALPAEGPLCGGEVMRLAGPGALFSWLGNDTVGSDRAVAAVLSAVAGPETAATSRTRT